MIDFFSSICDFFHLDFSLCFYSVLFLITYLGALWGFSLKKEKDFKKENWLAWTHLSISNTMIMGSTHLQKD